MKRAMRALAVRPWFTATAIATLALGLGVNAAIFSLTRAMLLRPLPYRDSDRLARVFEANPSRGQMNAAPTPVNYVYWRDRVDAFEQTALFTRVQFNLALPTSALQVEGFKVDEHFFPLLGIEPAFGRGIRADDTQKGRDAIALLSDGFWRRQFGADPAVVGRIIDVDGAPCTIVGVLPASFRIFRVLNRELDIFRPLVLDPTDREHSINVWAKLRPGASIDLAQAQLTAAYTTLPVPAEGWTATTSLMAARYASYTDSIVPLLQWAVGFVLLIACANVANLLLAVAAGRRKELAVRVALGASRWRIARDLGGESLLIAGAGTALAALLALWIVATFNRVISFQDINRSEPFAVDGWVLAFVVALATLVAIAFGLLPVRAAADLDVVDGLKEATHGSTGGGSSRRLRQALIVAELALAIVVAASAAVVARSAVALHTLTRGVSVDRVMTAQIALNDPRYADRDQLVRTTAAIAERLRSSPGIDAAGVANYLPLSLIRTGYRVKVEGYSAPDGLDPVVRYFVADPGYLGAAGIRLLDGRNFTTADNMNSASVAMISESFARRFWPGASAIGRSLRVDFPKSDAFWVPRAKGGPLTVVGVVNDVREDGIPDSQGFPQLYLPYAQNPTVVATLVARSAGATAESAAPAIRAAVQAIDSRLPLSYEMTFDDVVRETFARPREVAWIIGAFAALAFLLAAIGVYGVMAYSTTARAREIGIRLALGATRSDIVSLVVGQAMTLTGIGVAIGAAATPLSLRLMRGLLFGVSAFDPWTLGSVAAALAVVSAAAAAIPAWRAGRNDVRGSLIRP